MTGSDLDCTAAIARPMLKGGVRRVRRAPGIIQLGVDPDRSVLLTDLDVATQRWIDDLDGLRQPLGLVDHAVRAGVPTETAATVLALLARQGLLEDADAACPGWAELPLTVRDRLAPDLASLTLLDPSPDGGRRRIATRLAAWVDVHGGGRVGAALAELLAAAGVGKVRVIDQGRVGPADLGPAGLRESDLGRDRGEAATPPMLFRRRAAGAPGPDLIVFAADDVTRAVIDAGIAAGLHTPHLQLGIWETTGVIGPTVIPGRTACLRCLDLIRRDRDPDWPTVLARLGTPGRASSVPTPACDVVLATLVASLGALQTLDFIETGSSATLDGTLHVALPGGRIRRRSWQQHPACGCGWSETG